MEAAQKGGQMSDRGAAASGHCGQGHKQGKGPYRSSWRVIVGAGGGGGGPALTSSKSKARRQRGGFPAESPTDPP